MDQNEALQVIFNDLLSICFQSFLQWARDYLIILKTCFMEIENSVWFRCDEAAKKAGAVFGCLGRSPALGAGVAAWPRLALARTRLD